MKKRTNHLSRISFILASCAWVGTVMADETTEASQAGGGESQVEYSYPPRTAEPNAPGRAEADLGTRCLFNEDYAAAADAFLKAYILNPCQFKKEDLVAFKKTQRMSELAKCFDEPAFRKMCAFHLHNLDAFDLLRAVMKDPQTQDQRFRVLRNLFDAIPPIYQNWMLDRPERYSIVWKDVPDPGHYLRAKLVPNDFQEEGDVWKRFSIQTYCGFEAPESGPLTDLRPLYHNKQALRQFADEVQDLMQKHESWKSAISLQIVLETELGNHQKAVELLHENILGSNLDSIPDGATWMLGMALRDRHESLQPIATELLEVSLKSRAENAGAPLRSSPINELAVLYHKQGRKAEARQLIYGLVNTKNQHPTIRGYEPDTRGQCFNQQNCNLCHTRETDRNLRCFRLASHYLMEFGYPVDVYLSLARTDESYGHAFSSTPGWIDTSTAEGKSLAEVASREWTFNDDNESAERAITPRKVIEALEEDTFQRWTPTTQNENLASVMDLMMSVRGEGSDSLPTAFSPVINVLKLAVVAKDQTDERDIAELDNRLRLQSEANPKDIQAAVAATVFAFLRDDVGTAAKRLERLKQIADNSGQTVEPAHVTLWLAAREALKHESTRNIGTILGIKASVAAKTQSTNGVREAIRREYVASRSGRE